MARHAKPTARDTFVHAVRHHTLVLVNSMRTANLLIVATGAIVAAIFLALTVCTTDHPGTSYHPGITATPPTVESPGVVYLDFLEVHHG